MPCQQCLLRADDHVGERLKCPFASTYYESVDPVFMRKWFWTTYNLPRGDTQQRVFFDQGFVFAWESEPGQDYGNWTCCGPYKPNEVAKLERFQEEEEGIAYLKAERAGPHYNLDPFLK